MRPQKHNITVHMNQPLLLSNPKRREMRQGQTEPFWLVPELCNMTGLSDEMRNNFNLMKELSGFLNMAPQQRAQKLHQFSSRLNSNDEVKSLLNFWGLKFSKDLLKVNGRVLPPERIKTNRETEARDGSWNDAVKSKYLLRTHSSRPPSPTERLQMGCYNYSLFVRFLPFYSWRSFP